MAQPLGLRLLAFKLVVLASACWSCAGVGVLASACWSCWSCAGRVLASACWSACWSCAGVGVLASACWRRRAGVGVLVVCWRAGRVLVVCWRRRAGRVLASACWRRRAGVGVLVGVLVVCWRRRAGVGVLASACWSCAGVLVVCWRRRAGRVLASNSEIWLCTLFRRVSTFFRLGVKLPPCHRTARKRAMDTPIERVSNVAPNVAQCADAARLGFHPKMPEN